jgi:hypothetical protein
MDETAYRQIYSDVVERPCSFEKAILASCGACGRSSRIQIAEREAVTCQTASSLSRCTSLHNSLRHSFAFALKKVLDDTPLPHAQEMRIQCGGLKGLQYVLDGNAEVADVDAMLEFALQRWGELAEIPYSEVVHAAGVCFKGRHS